jgi:hypothetical protein
MTGNVVISEVDDPMYIVLNKVKKCTLGGTSWYH